MTQQPGAGFFQASPPRDPSAAMGTLREATRTFRVIFAMVLVFLAFFDILSLIAGIFVISTKHARGFLHAFQPFLVLLGIILVFVLVAGGLLRLHMQRLLRIAAQGQSTPATILKSGMQREQNTIHHTVTLGYQTPDGKHLQGTLSFETITHIFREGETLPILIDPTSPTRFLTYQPNLPLTLGRSRQA